MGEIKALRGTRDILPEEVNYWQQVETVAKEILTKAAYTEIRPPIFEQTALFERGIGEATDVVSKEMYTFVDRGDRSCTLRPEGTAGVVRAFIEHGLHAQGVQRLWYTGPMFRYERPQAGRQRQFHQIGLELIGSPSPVADVETIALATDILETLGLKHLSLQLNSVGNNDDRQRYREALVAYLTPYKDQLDSDSQYRLDRNPLRILDSKDEQTQAILENAPRLLDHLDADSQAHFEAVKRQLTALGIDYTINTNLVRGLDYYTHTAFEIQSADLGAQATVCGGGRYDGLIGQLGGNETPAMGWAIGMERLILLLKQLKPVPKPELDLYLVSRGDRATAQGLKIAQTLRHQGLRVELDLSGSQFKKQFKRADRSGAIACLIIGDEEVEQGTVNLKWMATQAQSVWQQSELIANGDQLRQQIWEAKHRE
ncbi:UNVERIFIED_CONTAM: histidine--tRNA ligase [Euhalothece sp. KZN 001]